MKREMSDALLDRVFPRKTRADTLTAARWEGAIPQMLWSLVVFLLTEHRFGRSSINQRPRKGQAIRSNGLMAEAGGQ
jgi:hypothetical protein